MGRKSESLQHALLGRAMKEKENNNTETLYKKRIKIFVKWAKEQGCKRPEDITKDVVQAYEQALETAPEGYAPATIHTYLSPVCAAAGINMREIRKPKRTAGAITRGRDRAADGTKLDRNPDGKRQEGKEKYARLVTLQRVTGIRRAELGKLVGSDLVHKGDSWYVRVRRGKGGKSQMQYILPKDVEAVREIFKGVGPDQKVFCKEEMSNKINLHGMRARHSKECYNYYAGFLARHPEYAKKFRNLLLRRWDKGHEELKVSDPRAWEAQRKRFISDMDDRPYKLRGENLRKARALGLPEEYNRLALMCVSVLHLSHWRLDVTTTNYLVT